MENVKGKWKGKGIASPSHLHNTNWNHNEVIALFNCKQDGHIIMK